MSRISCLDLIHAAGWVTLADLAAMLGARGCPVTPKTVVQWRARGLIRATRLGTAGPVLVRRDYAERIAPLLALRHHVLQHSCPAPVGRIWRTAPRQRAA